jgi:hypothetical protein
MVIRIRVRIHMPARIRTPMDGRNQIRILARNRIRTRTGRPVHTRPVPIPHRAARLRAGTRINQRVPTGIRNEADHRDPHRAAPAPDAERLDRSSRESQSTAGRFEIARELAQIHRSRRMPIRRLFS